METTLNKDNYDSISMLIFTPDLAFYIPFTYRDKMLELARKEESENLELERFYEWLQEKLESEAAWADITYCAPWLHEETTFHGANTLEMAKNYVDETFEMKWFNDLVTEFQDQKDN